MNGWMGAFILMKGINAKAFILSIIPLKALSIPVSAPLAPSGPSY